ncbi:ankyrin repeat domain-containing protein SOWAHB-like isoform X2 [Leptidea sinapis]|uniref:ankyrin repeat domain-containing protein SOWAHB-like isoform X2 n=1 Tax=Leptidea sinapis TaxID=189913 RepID=UPI0021329E59|nr:ankyrin repeat domain-containing protein SOWAHB-like isoform X2 [Leptidea sinapis]
MNTPPAELSFDEILKFMLAHNGKVTNHELVKHFKVFLMNPDMRDSARNTFKKLVNTLAVIKTQNNEKWLILKKKYMPVNNVKDISESTGFPNEVLSVPIDNNIGILEHQSVKPQDIITQAKPLQLNEDLNIVSSLIQAPAPMTPTSTLQVSLDSSERLDTPDDVPPKVHPRRKSTDKSISVKRPSVTNISPNMMVSDENSASSESPPTLKSSKSECLLVDGEQKISVKERKQMFNRMASESDVLKSNKLSFNSSNLDEDDRSSKTSLEQKENDPLDPRQKQWILCAARGDYHMLAKMCKENPKLAKTKVFLLSK